MPGKPFAQKHSIWLLSNARSSWACCCLRGPILMTIVLLLGLIKRQESGPAGLGWETVALGVIYVSGVIVQFY